jgi:hypothetical protein
MTNFNELFITYLQKGNRPPIGKCYIAQLALLAAGHEIRNLNRINRRCPDIGNVFVNNKIYKVRNELPFLKWFEIVDPHINQVWVKNGKVYRKSIPESVWISTVFLKIDHGLFQSVPLLFETMCFGHKKEYQTRASTVEQAKINHKYMVKLIISEQVKYADIQN